MKYMTPALLAQLQSPNEAEVDSASDQWELNCEAYSARIKEIAPELPKSVIRLLRRLNLHDAKLMTMTLDESPHLSLFIKLDGSTHKYVELRYRLVRPIAKSL